MGRVGPVRGCGGAGGVRVGSVRGGGSAAAWQAGLPEHPPRTHRRAWGRVWRGAGGGDRWFAEAPVREGRSRGTRGTGSAWLGSGQEGPASVTTYSTTTTTCARTTPWRGTRSSCRSSTLSTPTTTRSPGRTTRSMQAARRATGRGFANYRSRGPRGSNSTSAAECTSTCSWLRRCCGTSTVRISRRSGPFGSSPTTGCSSTYRGRIH